MRKPLSIIDRAEHGVVNAFFGLVFGAAASFFIGFLSDFTPRFALISVASAIYFFAVGFLRGADAGFFVGEAFTGLAAIAGAQYAEVPAPGNPDRWRSPALLVCWVALVVFLAWKW